MKKREEELQRLKKENEIMRRNIEEIYSLLDFNADPIQVAKNIGRAEALIEWMRAFDHIDLRL